MFSGHLSTRSLGLSTLVGLGLLAFAGCNQSSYDSALVYPVRTDYVVLAQQNWTAIPTSFNRPGVLPLDELKKPIHGHEPADEVKLREEVGKKVFDPEQLSRDIRAEFGKVLGTMFGTPASPTVTFNAEALKKADDGLTADSVTKDLKLSTAELAEGSASYRRQCLHCHGLEGNGRGPTGYWVNPPPRDYRSGIFKFTSSNQDQNKRKPRREDILHILTVGVEGTSMPSFGALPKKELDALVSYVIHLSLRGEAEYATMSDSLQKTYGVAKAEKSLAELKAKNASQADIVDATAKVEDAKKLPDFVATLRDDLKTPTLQQALEDNLALAANNWVAAQKDDALIKPAAYPYGTNEKDYLESATRGAKVFQGAGGCIQCHQNYGRESNMTYDSWGTIVRGRNLLEGVYRGGRRPVDLYYRVHSGINGAGMTSYKDIKAQLKPQDLGIDASLFEKVDPVWDIVNFLQALAYPDLRAKLRDDYKVKLDI